ncbi:MAG TPA: UDP-N-acetylglucosamine 2-epimerase [Bacteroidales bacterium]|nr:UDP-N-acetylglucosamine 2-epimerase [Bacteroidales bacterium]
MGRSGKLKVGVLSSSRADYGIYLPLLKKLQADPAFELEVVAFGTHLLEQYGQTVELISADGFNLQKVPDTMPASDAPVDIAASIGKTTQAFSNFFNTHHYDLVFALGDRFEMFSAVAATTPFIISVAHLHGGETTLGAIDNAFRHAITCLSKYHFTSTEIYKTRVIDIVGSDEKVYNVGALSIDNLKQLPLLSKEYFKEKFGIDLSLPGILFTFHPETVEYQKNETYINEIVNALELLSRYQLIVTMPNADTMGLLIRRKLEAFGKEKSNVILVENFGVQGYLSAMKHCAFMLGNTSSGFVEASFFPKWVINLGNRQKGRILTKNIISAEIEKEKIMDAVKLAEQMELPSDCNIYGAGNTAEKIVEIVKKEFF